jgi:hypothetical protein
VATESTFSKKVKLIGQTWIGQPQVRSSEQASGFKRPTSLPLPVLVPVLAKATPMTRMRLRRNDQFNRISNCLKFSKSEETLGGRIPVLDRPIPVAP